MKYINKSLVLSIIVACNLFNVQADNWRELQDIKRAEEMMASRREMVAWAFTARLIWDYSLDEAKTIGKDMSNIPVVEGLASSLGCNQRYGNDVLCELFRDLKLFNISDFYDDYRVYFIGKKLNDPVLRANMPSWLPNDDRYFDDWIAEEVIRIGEERKLYAPDYESGYLVARKDELVPIIKKIMSSDYPQGISDQTLNQKAEKIANKLIDNREARTGFAMVHNNPNARTMYIGLCAKALIMSESLTVSDFIDQARLALATFHKK